MFNPSLYVKQNNLQRRDAALVLQDLIHRMSWNQEENILDVGCGPGDVTVSVLSNYLPDDVTIVGCDISENMIKYAQATYENKRFKFRQLDVGNSNIWMNWDEESFDKIFSFYCLHWVKDLKQAAENMNTMLKNGGELVTLTPITHPFFELFRKIYDDPKWREQMKVMKTYDTIFKSFDHQEYLQVLESSGFEIISADVKERNYTHTSLEEFLEYLESVNPFVKRVSGNKLKELTEDCVKIMLQEGLLKRKKNDNVVHEFTTLTVHARKVKQAI
ncbi:Acid methyltransferase [Nesidiocoris tenuis]|uniref:Acid methyltransferase n=1 Tax=Nesidiocoris tenuis TaxID=355587 RepID=A0ABN7AF52_9HEMI|nr:Acid methyltransferase [Nesidiocoris tenuis]